MAPEKMHELYTHVAQRSFDVVVERKAQDWWHPSLDAVMTALAIDPLEAQDFSTGDRRKKPAMELPAHDLRSFADSGRLLDALKTVAQWVERRQPWTEEPEDEVPDMTSEVLGEALGDVLDFNQKLGAWSACKVLRWIVDRVSATRDQKRLCLSVADTVEGWVRSGVIDRVLLLNQRNAAEGLWSAAGSIGFVGAASVNCADTASSDVVSASRGAAYTVTWTISAVINNGDSPLTAIEKLRDVIADACRSFPVRSFEQQQFSIAKPRRNPSDTQSLRGMIEGRRGNDFSRFYGMSQEQVREHGDVVKSGRASRWTGPQGELVLIDPDYVRATDGNHFDPRKLAAVSDAVRSGQNPTFAVGYGTVLLIDEGLVQEDQESFASGELMSDRPLEKRDVGKLLYRVRDGNHRVFGALLGGENKVWMKLDKNMLQDMREYRAAKREKALAEYKKRYGQRHAKLMALLDTKLMKD